MSRSFDTVRCAVLGALCFIGSVACGPDYDRLELTGQKGSPLGGTVNAQMISIPEGMIVKVHVVPWNDDDEPMRGGARSLDTSILDVWPVVSDRDFAFVANKVGRTSVEFQANGRTVLTVHAEVTPQPEQPAF